MIQVSLLVPLFRCSSVNVFKKLVLLEYLGRGAHGTAPVSLRGSPHPVMVWMGPAAACLATLENPVNKV